MKNAFIIFIIILISMAGLWFLNKKNSISKPKPVLPYFGFDRFDTNKVDGEMRIDTVFHTIKNYHFINQNGDSVDNAITKNKIYVADFFFVKCPGICVDMALQMKRVFNAYKSNPNVVLLSHTVNPENDSAAVLLEYAQKQGVEKNQNWIFLTGDKKELYDLARTGYYVTATLGDGGKDDFVHTEKFVLIDKTKHIRGYYDGTSENDVNRLMYDMDKLLKE